jgi:oligopeptide/dipeptide ABC transporter ATP-binding protein
MMQERQESAESIPHSSSSSSVLDFRHVCQYFKDRNGGFVTACEDVNLSIRYGEVLAIVGESGSGKTTLGRISVGLQRPSKGEILLNGVDLREYKKPDLRKKAQYIHQDPYSALDPYLSVKEVLERPLVYVKGIKDSSQRYEIMVRILDDMGLEKYILRNSVRELSGGQKQRILLARAFIIEPAYVVADEPTTMVDFVRRAEIMTLLTNLKNKIGTSVLLITHDVSVASALSDRMAVMYRGEIVECASTAEIMKNPRHPYTLALLSVSPDNLIKQGTAALNVKRANFSIPPNFPGCRYSFLCPFAFDRCRGEHPQLVEIGAGHQVACYKVTT